MEQQRAAFEKLAASRGMSVDRWSNGNYTSPEVAKAWFIVENLYAIAQPAGEPVGEVTHGEGCTGIRWLDRYGVEELPEGTPLYTRPQPAVPEGWIAWGDDTPSEDGWYLTYWSDGALETYHIDIDDLHKHSISCGPAVLTHWAPLPAAPESSNG